jgi:hypothetical protein
VLITTAPSDRSGKKSSLRIYIFCQHYSPLSPRARYLPDREHQNSERSTAVVRTGTESVTSQFTPHCWPRTRAVLITTAPSDRSGKKSSLRIYMFCQHGFRRYAMSALLPLITPFTGKLRTKPLEMIAPIQRSASRMTMMPCSTEVKMLKRSEGIPATDHSLS